MGGQSLKFRKKQAREVAANMEVGKVKGQLKALKDLKWTEQLQLFAAKLTDKLSLGDLMEAIAVIGATVIIKKGIDWTQTSIPKAAIGMFITGALGFQPFSGFQPLIDLIAYLRGETTETPPQATQEDILEWLIAFALAYVIVHNFGQIVSGASSIIKVATTLLATA